MSRTQLTLNALVADLHLNCGDLFRACQQNGVSLAFVKAWCKDDPTVLAAIDEATQVGALRIESEAIRRAVDGYQKPVYFKGACVDHETVYSDGLMQTLLKGRLSHIYAKDADSMGGITVHGQAQINIMPRAKNYDEWLRMKESTLALRARETALPAPGVIDVEATRVPASPLEGLGL